MHLFLVRHGHCFGQSAPGTTDPDSVLTPLGEQQAQLTAACLVPAHVTHILSSPLVRALATASVIADLLDVGHIEVWPDLREGFSNRHRGFGREELLRRFPRVALPPSIASDGWDHGEDTYASLFSRAEHVLLRLKERFDPSARVVVVTHGGFANYLLHAILHIPSTAPQWFELDNCSISHVHLIPAHEQRTWPLYPAMETAILSVNDVAHLQR